MIKLMKFLIVGIGNPSYSKTRHNTGKYSKTRHNIGELLVNTFLSMKNILHIENTYNCKIETLVSCDFVNTCGSKVYAHAKSFDYTIVVVDDMETKLNKIRFVYPTNGHKGHNGIRDIMRYLKNDFCSVRIGIGRPKSGTVNEFVLGKFTDYELSTIMLLEEDFLAGLIKFIQKCSLK